jgi:hypothetical protein
MRPLFVLVLLATGCGGANEGVIIASNQDWPDFIAIDSSSVYWSTGEPGVGVTNGTVMKVGLSGGAPVTLASNQHLPRGLAVDAGSVYWVNFGASEDPQRDPDGSVMKVGLAGGTPFELASGLPGPGGLALGAEAAYWGMDSISLTTFARNIMKVGLAGGAPTVVASVERSGMSGLAVHAGAIYWSIPEKGRLMMTALADGSTSVLVDTGRLNEGLTLGSGTIYWASCEGVSRCEDGRISRVSLSGGSPVDLATGQPYPRAVAVDAEAVYWTNAGPGIMGSTNGSVMKVPLSGGSPVTLASNQATPCSIALSSGEVFWTNCGDGTVRKTAKR